MASGGWSDAEDGVIGDKGLVDSCIVVRELVDVMENK